MLDRLSPRMRRYLRMAVLSLFLGLALGYATFYFVFSTVAVPSSAEPSLAAVVLLLLGCAVLAGFLTQDIYAGTLQGFASLAIGLVVAGALDLSPVLSGAVQANAGELVFEAVQLGFPLFLMTIPLNLVGGLVGLGLHERAVVGPVGPRGSTRPKDPG